MKYEYKTKNTTGYNTISMGIFYEIGGYNYFNGQKKPRCFYIGARAQNTTILDNGHSISEYAMFDNSELAQACQNVIIGEAKRDNKKTIEKLYTSMDWEAYGEAIEKKDFEYMKNTIEKLKELYNK